MEGEINNLIAAWLAVVACLCYCHTIGKFIPAGKSRFIAILPVICIFLYIPLMFDTYLPIGIISFMVTWVSNFNLIQFSIGKGPLAANPPPPLFRFMFVACFPIIINNVSLETDCVEEIIKKKTSSIHMSPRGFATKVMLSALLMRCGEYKKYAHPKLLLLANCYQLYFSLDTVLGVFAIATQALGQVEVKPQFDKPYMATSVQDFWSRRWNLMVSGMLRTTVYEPVRQLCSPFVPRRWVSIPGVFATFVVSGIMHELLFCYMAKGKPNWQVTYFFLIQGFVVSAEIVVKKKLNGKYQLPVFVSRPITLAFILATSTWLFFPPFLRSKPFSRSCSECLAVIEFINNQRLVDSKDIFCPVFL